MTIKPDNRALRVLLWFVILFVPGGLILLGWVAAEQVQRRYRAGAAAPEPELGNAALARATNGGACEPARAA